MLIQFCCEQEKLNADELNMESIDDKTILAFLDNLEKNRGNLPRTRNQRLAAIISFYRYLALQEPTLMDACKRICAIRAKKTDHKVIEALTEAEVEAILRAVPSQTAWHQRDYALLLLMYNTGARVQELADLKLDDLKTDGNPQVRLKGKGRKERVNPLWEKTATAINQWLKAREQTNIRSEYLFVNSHRRQLSRFGIAHIVAKYGTSASETCASLSKKNVTPHTFRHTTALHMIQSDVDITVVKDWLGHADIRTTSIYVEINVEMKRKALEMCPPPGVEKDEQPLWHQPVVMALLDSIAKRNYVE
jgi:site-specific recombinase XerD